MSSGEIRVGDIVRLQEDEEIPCDLFLLSCSDEKGNCFIQTTNLDGESNLKVRSCLSSTSGIKNSSTAAAFRGELECSQPDDRLYQFDSRLQLNPGEAVIPVSADQLLLQATHLRNTEWVYGLVVYTGTLVVSRPADGANHFDTGNETKFGMNKKDPPPKWTKTDKLVNSFSLYIFLFQLSLVLIFGLTGELWKAQIGKDMPYLGYPSDEPGYQFLIIPARFLLLNSTMIPISLKVTMDLCKLFYARFIDRDVHLYDPVTNTPAHSNSTALGEDLGQIEYILSDKTGTLTENIMVLKVCSIENQQFGSMRDSGRGSQEGHSHDDPAMKGIMNDERLKQRIESQFRGETEPGQGGAALEFMRCLALNNAVIPAHQGGRIVYKASSPDEEALVKAAAVYNVKLIAREAEQVRIEVLGAAEEYTQLQELEFSSDRKRMSVLVRVKATGMLRLYVKGADDMILARLAAGEDTSITMQHLNAFAEKGLRTLLLGYRDLSEQEYEQWLVAYDEANSALDNRQEKKEAVYEALEKNFKLIGATAIEDKLQDGVPETIATLKEAGIRFWMLTGDKFSTALTIARTCNLKPKSTSLRTIEGNNEAEIGRCLREHVTDLRARGIIPAQEQQADARQSPRTPGYGSARMSTSTRQSTSDTVSSGSHVIVSPAANAEPEPTQYSYTVIIRGSDLREALEHHKALFSELCLAADSVICCRVTPKQKAELVLLVRAHGFMTLAIGDGGNDVGMIQEAHIGIGIRGKEGLQAARASDYQVAMFCALQRLLLVHGRYSYYRTSLVAQYSFYKSFLFCFMQIAFGFVSGFAGVSLFNSLCVAAYNAILFVPVVFFFLDKDISMSTALCNPGAYRVCAESTYMNKTTMAWWFARAIYQAVVIMIIGLLGVRNTESGDYESLGLLMFMAYLFVQDLTMTFELRYATTFNFGTIYGLHLVAILVGLMMNAVPGVQGFIDRGSFTNTLGDPAMWCLNMVMVVAAVLPVEAAKSWLLFYQGSTARNFRLYDIFGSRRRGARLDAQRSTSTTTALLGSVGPTRAGTGKPRNGANTTRGTRDVTPESLPPNGAVTQGTTHKPDGSVQVDNPAHRPSGVRAARSIPSSAADKVHEVTVSSRSRSKSPTTISVADSKHHISVAVGRMQSGSAESTPVYYDNPQNGGIKKLHNMASLSSPGSIELGPVHSHRASPLSVR